MRIFTILTFLILLLPMWKACDAKEAKEFSFESEMSETESSIEKNKQSNMGFLSIFIDNGLIFSGYQITWIIIEKIESKDLTGVLFFSPFLLYVLISIILVVFAFMKNKKQLFIWFSAINLCLIIFTYFQFFDLNNIYDIKYGFYLLIINSLLIFCSNFRTIKIKNISS